MRSRGQRMRIEACGAHLSPGVTASQRWWDWGDTSLPLWGRQPLWPLKWSSRYLPCALLHRNHKNGWMLTSIHAHTNDGVSLLASIWVFFALLRLVLSLCCRIPRENNSWHRETSSCRLSDFNFQWNFWEGTQPIIIILRNDYSRSAKRHYMLQLSVWKHRNRLCVCRRAAPISWVRFHGRDGKQSPCALPCYQFTILEAHCWGWSYSVVPLQIPKPVLSILSWCIILILINFFKISILPTPVNPVESSLLNHKLSGWDVSTLPSTFLH